jgi:hypothetical protein
MSEQVGRAEITMNPGRLAASLVLVLVLLLLLLGPFSLGGVIAFGPLGGATAEPGRSLAASSSSLLGVVSVRGATIVPQRVGDRPEQPPRLRRQRGIAPVIVVAIIVVVVTERGGGRSEQLPRL